MQPLLITEFILGMKWKRTFLTCVSSQAVFNFWIAEMAMLNLTTSINILSWLWNISLKTGRTQLNSTDFNSNSFVLHSARSKVFTIQLSVILAEEKSHNRQWGDVNNLVQLPSVSSESIIYLFTTNFCGLTDQSVSNDVQMLGTQPNCNIL